MLHRSRITHLAAGWGASLQAKVAAAPTPMLSFSARRAAAMVSSASCCATAGSEVRRLVTSASAASGVVVPPVAPLRPHLQETPTKDRMPPAGYDPRNPRRRLAVLVDGSKVSAAAFAATIEPALLTCGLPLLIRVFDTELRPEWVPLVEPHLAKGTATQTPASSNISSGNSGVVIPSPDADAPPVQRRVPAGPPIEWFRVDRFIPVSMQMAADATHIFEHRAYNRYEGVVYVCAEAERHLFERYFSRLQGHGFSQFSADELGIGTRVVEDGRPGDGAPEDA